jgi:hypothetical protein
VRLLEWLHECQVVWTAKLRQANWKRFSREDVGFKTRERASSEPEGVAGSSKNTTAAPVRLRCRTPSALFSLALVLFAFLILLLSQHRFIPFTFGIIMDDQKLKQPPPSIPYCARPRSRGLAPQQYLHLLSHLPTWTTVYTRSYCLPPQCQCPYDRQCFSLPHFWPPFIVSSHYRSPTYCSRSSAFVNREFQQQQ